MDTSDLKPVEKFRHTSLALGKSQFRLLRVEFKAADPVPIEYDEGATGPRECDQICCSVETFDFQEWPLPAYKAISYAWGARSPRYTISLNGRPFSVRENLWHFLRYCVNGTIDINIIYIWVDQICIDQKSTSERNHQLGLMSRIYKEAVQVVSWLGLTTPALEPGPVTYTLVDVVDLESWPDDVVDFESYPHKGLFSNPYWKRLWVAQEVMLAKNWVVFDGRHKIDGADIINYGGGDFPRHAAPALWVRHKREFNFREKPPDLRTVLLCFAHLDCEDPRDKVYGVLSLARNRRKVKIDYRQDPEEIFWSAFDAFKDSDIIDPSGLAQIARDMGVIRKELVILSDDHKGADER